MGGIDNGGPAFPAGLASDGKQVFSSSESDEGGMTLLDYFAGQAIQGWLASRESDVLLHRYGGDAEKTMNAMAHAAYLLALAMVDTKRKLGEALPGTRWPAAPSPSDAHGPSAERSSETVEPGGAGS